MADGIHILRLQEITEEPVPKKRRRAGPSVVSEGSRPHARRDRKGKGQPITAKRVAEGAGNKVVVVILGNTAVVVV